MVVSDESQVSFNPVEETHASSESCLSINEYHKRNGDKLHSKTVSKEKSYNAVNDKKKGTVLLQKKCATRKSVGYKIGGKNTPKKSRKKPVEKPSHKITEYFQVRRSNRRPESEIKEERCKLLEDAVRNCDESHLRIVDFGEKGRGVVCQKHLFRGDFVVEYKGELVDLVTAAEREKEYAKDPTAGCYMYYFMHTNTKYCVDATPESKFLGRLVNHSSKKPNLTTKTVQLADEADPRLILVAARHIAPDEELLYDYGERNKDAVASNPWLVKT